MDLTDKDAQLTSDKHVKEIQLRVLEQSDIHRCAIDRLNRERQTQTDRWNLDLNLTLFKELKRNHRFNM